MQYYLRLKLVMQWAFPIEDEGLRLEGQGKMMKCFVDYLSFFSCATLLVPISKVEGQHSIWHAPKSAFGTNSC